MGIDVRNEIRDFLSSRRARLTPDEVGMPSFGGGVRRVPGLRRHEVAMLAGVSVDYYTRLERGSLKGVSDSVLEGLAGALQLDEDERTHLFDLARLANAGVKVMHRNVPTRVRPGVQRLLDAITGAPAWVRNERGDVVATNELGRALYAPMFAGPGRPVNTARFTFLDPAAREFFPDWAATAREAVAVLRAAAVANPCEPGLVTLVGELSTRSEEFRGWWAAHDVRVHRRGGKRIAHPVVGELQLDFEALELVADPGLTMFTYSAEPGSESERSLALLGTWAATERSERLAAVRAGEAELDD
ncbi:MULTISPECIES: helix-turn-helix transcriptional regulator [unclassified Curtobacterium]|uniref:helix-turn-helix transcriptional regulator n=1 Tax=unclassified Curtobacterium TaxID=257496 RepID=UPI001AEA04E5|nr:MULTISPECIES: helix-turn-helix transcriptional regulator [unclassified Curtobacterium]MBP1301929.1 transcriptional regulator with XRE-family HTH domain [Curtobacterium sp. 1310]MCM3506355.1 helix-turn-helix transcriptional regulator [Curtobacterium sp. ODYSSEY 48 V2]MCM3522427.1 helix-turn-helix transcriptional regulator [Curtobacterium sp. P97]MDB6427597.1 helix-turn-helix transcriptional regulator [Curtobacterium sp. 20TX0008]